MREIDLTELPPRGAEPELAPAKRQALHMATAGSVGSSLIGQAALMVTGPLLARMLGLDGRGYLAALALWPALIGFLGSLGLPQAVTYYTAREGASARRVARAALSVAVPQTLLLMALHAAVLLLVLRDEPTSIRIAGAVTLAAVPASLAQQYGLAMLQGQQRFGAFNVLRLLPAISYAAGVSLLFVFGTTSILSVVLTLVGANAIAGTTTLLAGLRAARKADGGSVAADLGQMLRFGLRGLLGSFSPIETLRLDQVVLALFLAPTALGLYVVGLAFTNLPRFVAQSVGLVAYPSVAARSEVTAARRSMWVFFWATVAMTLLIVLPLLLSANWLVPAFFGSDFKDAVRVTQILLFGTLFASARRVLADGLRGRGHPTAGTVAEVAAWFWLAPALAAMVPLWGANGVALALSSSYAVSFGVLLLRAAVLGEMGWRDVFAVSPRRALSRWRPFPIPRWP